MFRAAEEIREHRDGYPFRLPNESDTLLDAAGFISLKRLCCPLLGFTLGVEAEGGPMWLRLTGREGVKPSSATRLANSSAGPSTGRHQFPPRNEVRRRRAGNAPSPELLDSLLYDYP